MKRTLTIHLLKTKRLAIFAAILSTSLLALTATGRAGETAGLTLYTSPSGNDSNDGRTAKAAFATLARARDEIRSLKTGGKFPSGGVTVEVQPGRYVLDRTLEFTASDSGLADAPVRFRATGSQPVQLLGGRVLKLSDFKPVTDPKSLQRLDSAARGKVVCISVNSLGLSHSDPFPPVFSDSGGIFELFWNGKRLPLSRWPNDGWTTMKRAVVNGDNKTPGTFEYRDDRVLRWLNNPSIWLKGQWRVPWEDPAIRIANINTNDRTITFAAGIPNGIGNKYTRPAGNGQEPWCAVNLIEEIDRPGEWALDFDSQTLFFWPPGPEGELMISQLDKPLISVNGASHLKFIGLTLEASLGDGFVIRSGESNLVAGCTIRNIAKRGVVLNGTRSGIQSSDIYNVGEGCVYVSGGDKKSLTASGNFVVNNHLHDYGVLKTMYSPAVDVGFGGMPNGAAFTNAVGIRVAHNLIHGGPRDAILVSGQYNVYEFNDISNCGYASGDLGAFYSWLDWTIRDAVVRYNFIHDTIGGVNPDDGASGFVVYGNVFAGPRIGVWIASGPDNTIQNNIFVKEEGPVFGMDDRGVARGYATNSRLHKAVVEINPTQPPWSVQFPLMTNLLVGHPELPLRTKVTQNVIVMQKGDPYVLKMNKTNIANPALFTWRDNFVTAQDPGFVNASAGNYALKPDSVVFKKIPGFQSIPFDKIGLYTDEYRTKLPTDAEAGRVPGRKPVGDKSDKNFGT